MAGESGPRAAPGPAPPSGDVPAAGGAAADTRDGAANHAGDGGAAGAGEGAAPFVSGFVALVGRPNVGKSSLVNRLVGAKVAITSPVPQTTRNRIAAVLHLPGAQAVLLDTPGWHRPRHLLGRAMVRAAASALAGADLACLVVDGGAARPGEGDRRAARQVARAGCPRILVVNKLDLVPRGELGARLEAYAALAPAEAPFAAVLAVSALTGEGCAELVAAIRGRLPPGPAYYPEGVVTDQPERALVAELIREQALHLLRDEVPHAVAVTVDQWRERERGLLYIGATLYVERESQKGIAIGRGGVMLRAIGQGARQEIERRLGTRVYLDLWVKVKEGWRDRAGSLETLGIRPV